MTDQPKAPTRRAPRRHSHRHAGKAGGATQTAPTANDAATQPASSGEPAASARRPLATLPVHVRWHDLDAFNHVNHAAYLVLLEEARLQWLRTVPGEWFSEHALPVAVSVQLNYRRPVTWPAGDIDAVLTCERLGHTSFTLGNRLVDHGDPTCVYADGSLVIVWMDPATGKTVPLPDALRAVCA